MGEKYLGSTGLGRFLEKLYGVFSERDHTHNASQIIDLPDIKDTTYTLTKDGDSIVLVGTDGTTQTIENTDESSVVAYGAKGDGSVDDTTAFQNALAANRTVTVPGGTYKLSGKLVVRENCCLELSQDTVLNFTQSSGNCIEMRGSATIRGNHGNINVSNSFTGNVVSVDTGLDGVVHAIIPPYEKSTPMWKRQRFIHDLNITRTEGSFQGSLIGEHSGTALYISANFETTETYDGTNTAPITYIWGMTVSGLRIGGAFDYGINIQNRDQTTSGYGNSKDPAWNHDMRIEAVIVGCETGVRVFNCNTAHLNVTVQPALSISKVNGVQIKYAKNGIVLERSNHIDLSQSIVWDWNAEGTLIGEDERNAHIALIGSCKGVILSDFLYHESAEDIRDLIYTDTPANFDSLIILQEPFTRWFKPVDNKPYFFDGNSNKLLVLKEELDNHFKTDRVAQFTDKLKTATDTDGGIYNGVGYKNNTYPYDSNFTSQKTNQSAINCATGFIPCKAGDILRGSDMSFVKAGNGDCFIALFDSSRTYINHIGHSNILDPNNYYIAHTGTEDSFEIIIRAKDKDGWTVNNNVAFVRFQFLNTAVGNNPVITVNEEITYTQVGFLDDGIKVKAENIVGSPSALPNPNSIIINDTPYNGSSAVSMELAKKTQGVFYIVGDSATEGVWTGTSDEITEYFDGLTVLYKTNVAGISGGTTLNINNLGAVSVKRNASTAITTTYPVGSVVMFTYSTTDGIGYWLTADYDANTKTTTGTSNKSGTKLYLAGATSQTSSGTTTYSNKNCYIGTDDRLYSAGEVVPNIDEITALITQQLGVIENGTY